MSKIVVIHQPDFLPYLGFFHRLLYCDIFVVLDHVQFSKKGWHSRDKIKSPDGKAVWLTVPVKNKKGTRPINQVRIDNNTHWQKKHLNILISYFSKAPFFKEIYYAIETIYHTDFEYLIDNNIALINLLMDFFAIKVDVVFSSNMNVVTSKTQLNIDIVKLLNADGYLSGTGAKDYLDETLFIKESVELFWQDFRHPVYPQVNGDFIPFLSAIDLLFNCGINQSRKILRDI